ncbi:MAG: hypothetical protein WA434_06965 [Candidatus Acidiferrales bacterium]
MKMLAAALCVLNAGLLVLSASGESPTVEQPGFRIEVQASGAGGPRYTVTNLTGKTVTACVIQLSSSSDGVSKSETVWDALLQEVPPIEPGSSISHYLSHAEGRPLPDKIEVVAGVWADGQTFGQPDWVKIILKARATRAVEYDQAASVLQQGLEENWTRDQYLRVFDDRQNSGPIQIIRSTLIANGRSEETPESLRRLVQTMRDSFLQKSNQIRKAKPSSGTVSN